MDVILSSVFSVISVAERILGFIWDWPVDTGRSPIYIGYAPHMATRNGFCRYGNGRQGLVPGKTDRLEQGRPDGQAREETPLPGLSLVDHRRRSCVCRLFSVPAVGLAVSQ